MDTVAGVHGGGWAHGQVPRVWTHGTSMAYGKRKETKRKEKGGRMEGTRDANVHADENDESATYAETKTKGSTLLRNHSLLQGPSDACSLPSERLVAVSQWIRTIRGTQSTRKRSRKPWPSNLSQCKRHESLLFLVVPWACLYFIVSKNERKHVHALIGRKNVLNQCEKVAKQSVKIAL